MCTLRRRTKRAGAAVNQTERIHFGNALLLTLAGMKAGEDEKLHRSSDPARILNGSPAPCVQSRLVSGKIANGPPHGYMSGGMPHISLTTKPANCTRRAERREFRNLPCARNLGPGFRLEKSGGFRGRGHGRVAPGEVGMFFKLCAIDRPEWLRKLSRRADPVREN